MLCTFFKGGAYFHLVLHILMSKATLKAWNSYNREVNISLEKMFWNEKRGCDLLYEKSLPFSVFGELVFTDGLVFNACFCGQRRYEPFIHSCTMLGFMSKWFFLLFTLFRIPMNWKSLKGIFSNFLIPKKHYLDVIYFEILVSHSGIPSSIILSENLLRGKLTKSYTVYL